MVVNCAEFDACTSSSFLGVKTDTRTVDTQSDRTALYGIDLHCIVLKDYDDTKTEGQMCVVVC